MLALVLVGCGLNGTPWPGADDELARWHSGWGGGGGSFVPVAMGFEYLGGIDATGAMSTGLIEGYEVEPYMVLQVAGIDYFQGDPNATCEFIASPYRPTHLGCDLATADGADLYDSYESTIHITYSSCQGRLVPLVYDALLQAFEGMRLGIGFGPLTANLSQFLSLDDLALEPSMTAMYVAMVAPDGSFVGQDWTLSMSYEMDPVTRVVSLDKDGHPVPSTADNGLNLEPAYLVGYAFWFEELVDLNVAGLHAPIPPICQCAPPGPDTDGDGQCDANDPCPMDNPDDTDRDGMCDSDDPCPDDDTNDRDGDGVCNEDDPCPDDADNDADGDGLCAGDDPCPEDFGNDLDGDGVCESDDPCPDDSPDDSDGDGVCDSDDPCPGDAPDDPDGDGLCGTTPVPTGGTDPEPTDEAEGGCGCASGPANGPWGLALLGPLLLRRRRAMRDGSRPSGG